MARLKNVKFRKNRIYRFYSIHEGVMHDTLLRYKKLKKDVLVFECIHTFHPIRPGVDTDCTGYEVCYEKDFIGNQKLFVIRNAKPAEIALYGKKHS